MSVAAVGGRVFNVLIYLVSCSESEFRVLAATALSFVIVNVGIGNVNVRWMDIARMAMLDVFFASSARNWRSEIYCNLHDWSTSGYMIGLRAESLLRIQFLFIVSFAKRQSRIIIIGIIREASSR